MDEAERCARVGYIYNSRLIICGQPDELKRFSDVTPEGTKWAEVNCQQTTIALAELKKAPFVRSATIFGQSIHLLMDANEPLASIVEALSRAGISGAEVTLARPSLEDVFVTLTRKFAENGGSKTQR
jgi:ABC-type multidrug transport system ATPase subunit